MTPLVWLGRKTSTQTNKLPIANPFFFNIAEHENFSANDNENANIFISRENFMLSWVYNEKKKKQQKNPYILGAWPATDTDLFYLSFTCNTTTWVGRPGGRGFNPRRGRQHSFVEIDHEIFSTVILSLPLIQEGQLSVSGKRMCTILVNRLED